MSSQPPQPIEEAAASVTLSDPLYSGPSNLADKHMSGQPKRDVMNLGTPNVILYGETGVGKLSIINLIAGRELAQTSNDLLRCTFQHQQYIVQLGGMSCALWDTTGLEEGSEGTVPAAQAESNLKSLIEDLAKTGGIHLVIYCARVGRLTKALQHNYDLFYVTVCRKKVPVALVVTGLENQQDEMETWWATNETMFRLHEMQFDAHACVTTLDVEDRAVQERRLHSQQLLRDLVTRYARLPGWKADSSFLPRVLPAFRTVIRRTSPTGRPGSPTTMCKAIVCDMTDDALVEFSPGITCVWETFTTRIGDRWYEFTRMSKDTALQSHATPSEDVQVGSAKAGVLIFYTSTLLGGRISSKDIDALRAFYEIADGQVSPVIVVLRGCNDEEVARACQVEIASRYGNIQARFVSLPSTGNGNSERRRLNEMIRWLYIDQDKNPALTNRKYRVGRRLLARVVGLVNGLYASGM